ncbi:hypothetical protein PR048_009187 [Dryococelus australis]|uniref:Uncharacterized protein n=1 Tax=Dryococelus australis TaxID=614101 RepID=A0ABQ9HZY7_9NEOP|nr:hypothetical protein PR048_009187 [Dryococelus australis]
MCLHTCCRVLDDHDRSAGRKTGMNRANDLLVQLPATSRNFTSVPHVHQNHQEGGENGRPPRKLTDQRHRPPRFPYTKIWSDPPEDLTRFDLVGGEQANRSTTITPSSEVRIDQRRNTRAGGGDREIPEETRRIAASSGTCGKPGVTQTDIEPGMSGTMATIVAMNTTRKRKGIDEESPNSAWQRASYLRDIKIRVRAGLEIEMKIILNHRNRRIEISIRDQQRSSTNLRCTVLRLLPCPPDVRKLHFLVVSSGDGCRLLTRDTGLVLLEPRKPCDVRGGCRGLPLSQAVPPLCKRFRQWIRLVGPPGNTPLSSVYHLVQFCRPVVLISLVENAMLFGVAHQVTNLGFRLCGFHLIGIA